MVGRRKHLPLFMKTMATTIAVVAACACFMISSSDAKTRVSVPLLSYSSASACLAAFAKLRTVCEEMASGDGRVQVGRIDVDGDGRRDLVVRRQSRMSCGSKGCSTDIYLQRSGALVIAEPRLVTDGRIVTCESEGNRGLKAAAPPSAPCFIFRTKR